MDTKEIVIRLYSETDKVVVVGRHDAGPDAHELIENLLIRLIHRRILLVALKMPEWHTVQEHLFRRRVYSVRRMSLVKVAVPSLAV